MYVNEEYVHETNWMGGWMEKKRTTTTTAAANKTKQNKTNNNRENDPQRGGFAKRTTDGPSPISDIVCETWKMV